MPATIGLKATGLQTSPNPLDLQPGALTEAVNIIIKRDNVIESRRGFKLWAENFGSSSDRDKQLIDYQNRILVHFSNKLAYDTGTTDSEGLEIFHNFFGNVLEAKPGLRIKSIEENGNLYFTSSNGIQKISASSPNDFGPFSTSPAALPGYITQAGGIKAIDFTATLKITPNSQSGFLTQDGIVAYRIVWGITDNNNVLVLGAPSQRVQVSNPLTSLMLTDYMRILGALDNIDQAGSIIDDGNYVQTLGLPATASSNQLNTNLQSLSAKLDNDILYADNVSVAPLQIGSVDITGTVCTITFSSGDPSLYVSSGSPIFLAGFNPTIGTLDGAQIVSTVNSTTLTFNTTAKNSVPVSSPTINSNKLFADNVGGAPLQISSATISGGVCTVTFSSGDPTQLMMPGSIITLAGFSPTSGTLNGQQTVVTSTTTTITFNTPATGLVTLSSPTINSFALFADNVGVAALQIGPVEISGSTCTITFSSGNPASVMAPGDSIILNGFIPTTGTLDGLETVVTVGATTITFATSATNTIPLTSPTINSNIFRSIPVAASPDVPPTDAELVAIQNYIDQIISALQLLPNAVVSTMLLDEFLLPLDITTTASVILDIDIPEGITTNYFVQIYRSQVLVATGTTVLANLVPSDELQLVYEANPTAAELAAGHMVVEDIVPDAFLGANLYTNAFSGQGILQANDVPPFALDINRFKNYTFYANTRTRQRLSLNLLGVSNFKAGNITSVSMANPTVITTDTPHLLSTGDIVSIDGTNSTPVVSGLFSVTVTGANTFTVPVNVTVAGTQGYWTNALLAINSTSSNNIYKFIKGTFESTTFTCLAANSGSYGAGGISGKYFTINSSGDKKLYYVWYNTGSSTDPAPMGRIGIEVLVGPTDSATVVAQKTANVVSIQLNDFTTSALSTQVTITNTLVGYTTDATVGTSLFTISISKGIGENASKNEVLLSPLVSPSQAVSETANSLIHVINANASEVVYGYYISGAGDVPGKMLVEGRALDINPFYILANTKAMGTSFSPDISPTSTQTLTNTATNPTVITVPTHGLISGDQVLIEFSNSTPSINGIYTINFLSVNTFSIPVNVTVAGTTGIISKAVKSTGSQDDVKPNRIYYSKLQQPEAVPIVNFIDVGAENGQILRIFPLRDSLFIFKEDGLYRLSSEVAPFTISLFDGSCILIAPDSVDTTNNLVYCWTTQGINTVSESGVSLISRPIDVDILKLASSNYPNFGTATFGIGYRSDNAYYVWTVSQTTDTVATIVYRYSNLTNSWTTFDKSNTCGLVRQLDDKLYLGPGDVNSIEQERKTFDRTDYADRELQETLSFGSLFVDGVTISLPDVSGIAVGDVFLQAQLVTTYNYNILLEKLDLDPGVGQVPITATTTGSVVQITTSTSPAISTGDFVTLLNTDTVPTIDGVYQATVIDAFNFTVNVPRPVTFAGTMGFAKFNYYNTLKAVAGNDMRTDLLNLAARLDADPNLVYGQYATLIASIGPESITNNTAANPTVITSVAHGLVTGRVIIISGSDSTPPIDGMFEVTVIDADHFSIPYSVQVSGTAGTFSTLNQEFQDQEACYNAIVDQLNLDNGTSFKNYVRIVDTTNQEAIVTNVNLTLKRITINLVLDLIVGPFTIFKAINSHFIYAPITMGDTLGLKHIREATMMFQNKAFTDATLSFATDLLPQLIDVPFNGDGNGIFGFQPFGAGFFGGASNSAPFRTLIPRQCQRCRYLIIKFDHTAAREQYSIFGMSVTGEVGLSSRAYR